jgi:hypothetical protein
MEFDDAFGWLITWTTYGTCFPGDPRGHVSPALKNDGSYARRSNQPSVEWAAGNHETLRRASALQRFETVRLRSEEAYVAEQGWILAEIVDNECRRVDHSDM